ncbi:14944_t:CDS:2 [Funneliformis mosseae]|uniref:14944_t:CDS:1 n=1 Tax=Funneliformis mosseae TaxID=27381 RepID=A0A9N9HUK1_FUNMO|nr:14944_t:CDS:2 [Funneliformis mosseae]
MSYFIKARIAFIEYLIQYTLIILKELEPPSDILNRDVTLVDHLESIRRVPNFPIASCLDDVIPPSHVLRRHPTFGKPNVPILVKQFHFLVMNGETVRLKRLS